MSIGCYNINDDIQNKKYYIPIDGYNSVSVAVATADTNRKPRRIPIEAFLIL